MKNCVAAGFSIEHTRVTISNEYKGGAVPYRQTYNLFYSYRQMLASDPSKFENLASTASRKSMNMSDVYSADSPKSEKRKQSSTTISKMMDATLAKNKSEITLLIINFQLVFSYIERKTLNARNESDNEDDN